MSAREEKARLDGWDDAIEHVKGLVGKMDFKKIMECNKEY